MPEKFRFRNYSNLPRNVPSLKLTANAPENGWLEDEISIGDGLFGGQTVSFRECMFCGPKMDSLKAGRCG